MTTNAGRSRRRNRGRWRAFRLTLDRTHPCCARVGHPKTRLGAWGGYGVDWLGGVEMRGELAALSRESWARRLVLRFP
jgi:hypothetical protein